MTKFLRTLPILAFTFWVPGAFSAISLQPEAPVDECTKDLAGAIPKVQLASDDIADLAGLPTAVRSIQGPILFTSALVSTVVAGVPRVMGNAMDFNGSSSQGRDILVPLVGWLTLLRRGGVSEKVLGNLLGELILQLAESLLKYKVLLIKRMNAQMTTGFEALSDGQSGDLSMHAFILLREALIELVLNSLRSRLDPQARAKEVLNLRVDRKLSNALTEVDVPFDRRSFREKVSAWVEKHQADAGLPLPIR